MNSLATMSRAQVQMGQDGPTNIRTTKPVPLQAKALALLGLKET